MRITWTRILLPCSKYLTLVIIGELHYKPNAIASPSFTTPLFDSILLCEHNTSIIPSVNGHNLTFTWTINGATHSSTDSWLYLTEEDLPCESNHTICITATNPAGSVQSCGSFLVLKMQSIFHKTPSPKDHPQSVWFAGTNAVFRVEITPKICTRHTWWINNQLVAEHEGLHSNLKLNITTDLQDAHVYVLAECGNSVVKSKTYTFRSVSELTIFGLVIIIVCVVIVVGGAVILLVVFKRKKNKHSDYDEELQSLVVRDKTKEEAEWILQTTRYAWSPSMEYLFKPIDKLPFSVHASQFSAISKPQDNSAAYAVRTDVIFTRKKSLSNDGLKEPLIGGTKIDLYVPPEHGNFTLDPPSVVLSSSAVSAGLSATMAAGAKVCLLVVCEQLKIYSMLEFKLKI